MFPTKLIRIFLLPLTLIPTLFLYSCSEQPPPFTCTDSIGCVTIAPEEPLKIGVLQALSGDVALLGEAQLNGMQLALDKRGSTLLGHTISLQIEDTGCTPEGGANTALKLIADPQTIAIFGSTCSGAAATASQTMSAAGLTMISGNNSAPFLTSIAGKAAPNWQSGYFRTASNEENAGKVAAEYVFKQLGLQKAATIHDNDIYTRGLTDSFQKAYTNLGGQIVLDTAINKGETEMAPVLAAVVNSGAELLFFPLFQPEGNHILLQARTQQALKDILFIGGGALIQKSFLDETGELAKGMFFVGPSSPKTAEAAQLANSYETTFNEQPTVDYYLSGYDAVDLLFYAIEQTMVREEDGTLHLGRQALRDTLYSITDFKGVTGMINCNQFGDCALSAFDILRLDQPTSGLKGLQSNVVFSYVLEN